PRLGDELGVGDGRGRGAAARREEDQVPGDDEQQEDRPAGPARDARSARRRGGRVVRPCRRRHPRPLASRRRDRSVRWWAGGRAAPAPPPVPPSPPLAGPLLAHAATIVSVGMPRAGGADWSAHWCADPPPPAQEEAAVATCRPADVRGADQ